MRLFVDHVRSIQSSPNPQNWIEHHAETAINRASPKTHQSTTG